MAEHGDQAKPLAGGQSLIPLLAMRLVRPSHIVDLHRVAELQQVSVTDGRVSNGAMARQRDIEHDPRMPGLVRDAVPPVGPCRGIGHNAAVFATERMMDVVAAELEIDPLELRRRNAVRGLPWTSPVGKELDSGDYLALLKRLEEESNYRELRREQAEARSEGRLVGIGFSLFNEITASGSADYRHRGVTSVPGTDAASVVVTPAGRVEIYTSAADAGQGHAETYRTLAEREVGLRPEEIDVIEGDTASCPEGSGTIISRGAVGVVESVVEALRKAAKEDFEPGTDVTHVHDPSQVYASGAHLVVVEIDPVGLVPHVVRYVAIEDCGRMLDRDLVEGQVRGAVAMGIGKVLLEEHTYSENGQLLTSSLRHYLPPLAPDVPAVEMHHLESLSPNTRPGQQRGRRGRYHRRLRRDRQRRRRRGRCTQTELTELPYSPERIFLVTRGNPSA